MFKQIILISKIDYVIKFWFHIWVKLYRIIPHFALNGHHIILCTPFEVYKLGNLHQITVYSNITSFFRFVNKLAS